MSVVIVKHSDTETGIEAGIMVGFPLAEDQYFEGDDSELIIYLADAEDLSIAQEQHLDTNPHVITYDLQSE